MEDFINSAAFKEDAEGHSQDWSNGGLGSDRICQAIYHKG